MLRMSTKGRYATRIMVYLALCDPEVPARKQEIARAEGIPTDYVEQILTRLRTAGLVKSQRGAGGGFQLLRDPRNITVADVIRVTEGPLSLVACIDEGCNRSANCVTRSLWMEANDALVEIFSNKTIDSLAREAKQKK